MTHSHTCHIPVLMNEVLEGLALAPGKRIVDGTLGGGGHALAIWKAVQPGGQVIGIDRDPIAAEETEAILPKDGLTCFCANYCDLPELLANQELGKVDGILLDLGLSSDQLADENRGFSFNSTGPLDLRFDTTRGEPASRLINRLSPEHLADLIYQFGEEKLSRRVARAIVRKRQQKKIETSAELAEVIRAVMPKHSKERIDPATRTFQALRIAVNEELKALETALRRMPDCLNPGGRLVMISFHSLEDRRVKHAFAGDERLNVLTRKPIQAQPEEVASNPRSRSAKLRVAERVD